MTLPRQDPEGNAGARQPWNPHRSNIGKGRLGVGGSVFGVIALGLLFGFHYKTVRQFVLPMTDVQPQRAGLFGRGSNPELPAILFFFCGCRRCKGVARQLREVMQHSTVPLLGVTELGPADRRSFNRNVGISISLSQDPAPDLTRSYRVNHCPAIRTVARTGRVIFAWDSNDEDQLPRRELAQLRATLGEVHH
jgi:hypothetical protein